MKNSFTEVEIFENFRSRRRESELTTGLKTHSAYYQTNEEPENILKTRTREIQSKMGESSW